MATPSTCSYKFPSNWKSCFFVAISNSSTRSNAFLFPLKLSSAAKQMLLFNLENIYYLPSWSSGSATPSLHHFLLDNWKPVGGGGGGTSIWKSRKECSSENLNLTSTGDLCARCLSFIIQYNNLFAFPFEIRLQEIYIYIFFFYDKILSNFDICI